MGVSLIEREKIEIAMLLTSLVKLRIYICVRMCIKVMRIFSYKLGLGHLQHRSEEVI